MISASHPQVKPRPVSAEQRPPKGSAYLRRLQEQSEIKRAYRKAARSAHPDHGGQAEQMAEINEAYETAIALTTTQ